MIAARPVDQRHADLLDRAPPRGDGGVHPRDRAAGRGGRRPARRSRRSRASSSRASTPRPTSGSRGGTPSCRASSRSRTPSSPTRPGRRSSAGERWEALEAKGATKQWCLWASTSTKNPAYRDVMYVEELIGPDTVNTMPEETIEAFQDHGEVRVTIEEGVDEARKRLRGRRGGRRLDRRRHPRARGGGRAEVLRLVRRAPRRDQGEARRAGLRLIEPAELVERIWERDPTVWTGHDEAHWLGLARRAAACARASRRAERARRLGATPTTSSCSGWAGRRSRPEVLRRAFERDRFHVLDTTHPKAIRRLAESMDLDRTLFVVSSKSGGTLETRSHFDFFWERGATAVRRDHRPGLAARRSRPGAQGRGSSPASRRSAAGTRRSRRSGSSPPR